MAEISIDQSKLPGVKEVCRDFAVLEDHTLAHSLQEQEIEHHLATNVQRNRLVQGDLQIAKQLQEEEDRRARACIQERHKDIERQDCEIAQEIQVKLVIEAEQLRRQEEDDEDIARVLQQKELHGEKKKKRKPLAEPSGQGGYKESSYLDSRDRPSRSPPGQPSRSRSGDRQPRQPRDTRRAPPFVSEGLELEVLGSSSEGRKAKDSQRRHRERQQDKKPGGREKLWKEVEGEALEGGSSRSRDGRAASEEGPRKTSLLGREAGHGHRRRPRSRERPQSLVDWRDEEASRHHKRRERLSPSSEKSLRPPGLGAEDKEERRSRRPDGGHRPPAREERQSPRPPSHDRRPRDPDTASQRSHRKLVERGEEGGRVGEPSSSSSSSRHGESQELDLRCSRQPGTKSQGTKEATFPKSHGVVVQDLESFDAEIAWKLQEEELLASQADEKAAQVAQDEEIARLLMAEEEKKKKKAAYKKAKEREKPPSEKKRQDQNWKHNTSESGGPGSREDHDPHRGRSDKPTRPPPPPTEELDHLVNLTSQQNSAHQVPKPEPPHKGYHYKP